MVYIKHFGKCQIINSSNTSTTVIKVGGSSMCLSESNSKLGHNENTSLQDLKKCNVGGATALNYYCYYCYYKEVVKLDRMFRRHFTLIDKTRLDNVC